MKTNVLSTTALIVGLGLLSSFTGARSSIASQSLVQTEQYSASALAQNPRQPWSDQTQQSPEDLRRQRQQQQNGQDWQRQRQDAFEHQRQQQQNGQDWQRQRQDAFEHQRQQQQNGQDWQRQRQDAFEHQRQQQQNGQDWQRQRRDAQQRQRLQEQQEQQFTNRRNRKDQFNRQLAQQRVVWQRDRDRSRNSWLRQQNLFERERRLDRFDARQRNLYRSYATYYNRDYWEDINWRNRDYWNNRTFWSGPGYWYERDYWGQRGYIWDDVLGGILQGLISGLVQGAIGSAFSPYRQASTLYDQGPQILSYNGLTQTACEPGNIVILLPNQRVMCATPTYSFVPGTYQVRSPGLNLIPADIQY
jgi:hypothetical protein